MDEKYIMQLTETTQRTKSNSYQIEEIKDEVKAIREDNKAIQKIATSVELIANDMRYMKNDIGEVKSSQAELKAELKEVENQPTKEKAELVNTAKKLLFTAVCTGIIAFILGNVCPVIFK